MIKDRLRQAIAKSDYATIKEFQQAMEGVGAPASSYAQIHRFMSPSYDGPVPPVEFLRYAAHLLCVREPWLICGQGWAPRPSSGKESALWA